MVSSGKKAEYRNARNLLIRYNLDWVRIESNELNLSKLFNEGVKNSQADYIQILGCDFICRRDYLQTVADNIAQDKLLIKRVKMIDQKKSRDIDFKALDKWDFGEYPYNEYGDYANGIICASRSFFEEVPYDERFKLLGGMDNLQVMKAKKRMRVEWLEGSEILHIWHKVSQLKGHRQFQQNQQYIKDYVKKSGPAVRATKERN